ncbi:membrane protein [Streptomyces noursei ATCC 11455]|nr:membrane protein [Streptomyces noursei ATCC 11455]
MHALHDTGAMNGTAAAVAVAATFVWLGMVLAISFLEAPLKFRAPGVTIPLGLGIGRLVFRALNAVEAVLAVVLVTAVALASPPAPVVVLTVLGALLLAVQLTAVRPVLNRRSDRVLAGETLPRSRAHLVYIAFETVKVGTLLALGITALAYGS